MLHAMVAAAILIGTAASPPPAPAPVLVVVAPARPPHQPHQQPAGADDGASVATVPTLLAARAAARRLTAAGAATVEVRLLPGVHALAEPLRLSGAQDSGVRWRGAPGAVVSGGAALSGWSAAGASGTWTAPLPSGVEFSRILWVNGERRNRTVVHGADCCNVHSTSGIFELGGETVALTAITEKGYVGNSSSFLQLENAADVELIYTRVGSSWTEGRCTLDSIVPHADGAELLVKQPCFANQRNKSYNLAVSFPLSLEQVSLASALSPGDWYLDRAKNRVVFMPTAADAALGPAKSVGSVLSAVGTDAASTALLDLDGVTGVTFEGVHFTEGDGWGGASNALGYTETQAAYHASAGSAPGQFPGFNDSAWVAVPPAIHVHGGSSGVYFTGCKFTRMGASAVMLSGGSSHGHVTNSTFTDLSGSAVMLGQVDDWKEKDESKQNRGFILAHNTVSRTSLEYRGSPGITAAYVRDTVIEKNDSGVSIGWGWGREDRYNHIHHHMCGPLYDGGSMYTLGPQDHDGGSGYFHSYDNVIDKAAGPDSSRQQLKHDDEAVLNVAVDWPSFLSRHDLMWEWVWGSSAASTLSPRNEHLHRCGPGESAGQCCLEAAAPKQAVQLELEPAFAGFIQLALPKQSPWGCSPTAVPARLCCLPVPDHNGGAISGCHEREQKKWHFNQFFSIEPAAKGGFKLLDKASKSCYTLKAGGKAPTLATCEALGQSSNEQVWSVVKEGYRGFLLKNLGSSTCVTAADAHEASSVTMGSCTLDAKGANSWQPVCDGGKSPLPDWPCLNVSNTPPAPPHPHPGPPPPPVHGDFVTLATCDGSKLGQQWQIDALGHVSVGDGSRCLSRGGVVAPCNSTGQTWGPPTPIDGFFQMSGKSDLDAITTSKGVGTCLTVSTARDFCTMSVCPIADVQDFKLGMNLTVANCNNGNQAQLFAATYKGSDGSTKENLLPLFWATAAYVGNGVMGLRVQAEAEAAGVFQLLLDNNNAGRGGHRMETGYYRLHTNAPANVGELRVTIRQRIYNGLLEVNVTSKTGAAVCSFTAFVNAGDTDTPVAVISIEGSALATPSLEWVARKGNTAFGNKTVAAGSSGAQTIYMSVLASPKQTAAQATAAAAAAATTGRAALLAASTAWWASFWPESFVALPTTRLEGFYYTQMYRFVSSDRVGLHGLMGAFGPTGNFNLWGDDVWDMNEQVMYWLAAASNHPAISDPMMEIVGGGTNGGIWMLHNYWKVAWFEGRKEELSKTLWPQLVSQLNGTLGETENSTKLKMIGDTYHIVGCKSPEYRCYEPFEFRACSTTQDCNYEISQLRWGLTTVLELMDDDVSLSAAPCGVEGKVCAVDFAWWRRLIGGALAWYPHDNITGFRLDKSCAFECPHRHFSHLLQMYDLETVEYRPVAQGGNATINDLMHKSLDNWFRVTCNASNVFNEECRGFTQCGMSAMSAVTGRADAAVGNLTGLIDTVITPNGMYGEMVFMDNPNEFAPVSESAYCGAGNVHTVLLHTSPLSKVLGVFHAVPAEWQDVGFHQLRAGGGLLVSANRTAGETKFVRVRSAHGGKVMMRVNDVAWDSAGSPPSSIPAAVKVSAVLGLAGLWSFTLAANQSVVLYLGATAPELTIAPLAGNASEFNWFGYTREMQPLH